MFSLSISFTPSVRLKAQETIRRTMSAGRRVAEMAGRVGPGRVGSGRVGTIRFFCTHAEQRALRATSSQRPGGGGNNRRERGKGDSGFADYATSEPQASHGSNGSKRVLCVFRRRKTYTYTWFVPSLGLRGPSIIPIKNRGMETFTSEPRVFRRKRRHTSILPIKNRGMETFTSENLVFFDVIVAIP